MNEWVIFVTIGEIVIFFIAIITPMIKLNTTIVKLNDAIDRLDERFDTLSTRNDVSHDRLWKEVGHLDDVSNDHEKRIVILEKMEERK